MLLDNVLMNSIDHKYNWYLPILHLGFKMVTGVHKFNNMTSDKQYEPKLKYKHKSPKVIPT